MFIRNNKGFITLTILGCLVAVGFLLFFGYVVAASVVTGIFGGSISAWLCNGLRRYPGSHIDVRDTD